jgi:hypothetical protein
MTDEANQERIDFPDYPPMDETGMVDLWQIEAALKMTPAERIRRHDEFREFLRVVRKAGMKYYGLDAGADSPIESREG